MEADAALVGAKRRVELHAEAAVDLDLVLVIDPRHAEDDLTLGLADPLDQRLVQIVRVLGHNAAEAFQNFDHGLVKLGLARIALHDLCEDGLEFFINTVHGQAFRISGNRGNFPNSEYSYE